MVLHRLRFFKKYNLPNKSYSLEELSKISGYSLSTLQQVYQRGLGAYRTNYSSVRTLKTFVKGTLAPPSQKLSPQQWAYARVYSFLDNNPKHDNDLRRNS